MPEAADVSAQVHAIVEHRQLLDSTDPVPALASKLGNALRHRITELAGVADKIHGEQLDALGADQAWKTLGDKNRTGRDEIATKHRLGPPEAVSVGTEEELIEALAKRKLTSWSELIAAIPGQFDSARREAAQALEPKAQSVKLPSATIKDKDDLAAWLKSAESAITAKLGEGPVII